MNTRQRVWIPDNKHFSDTPLEIGLPRAGLAGFLTFDLVDGKTGKVKQHLECPNLITNTLMEQLGSGQCVLSPWHFDTTNFVFFAMGTGSTTPTVDDTTLVAEIGPRTKSNGGFSDVIGFQTSSGWPTNKSGSYHFSRVTRVFTENEVTGTLAEFGLFTGSVGGPMGVRSLIKDASGTPTTINKQVGDQLRVTHELRIYPPVDQDAVSGTIVIAATSYSYTASALDIDNQGAWGFVAGGLGIGLGLWGTAAAFTSPSASRIIDVTGSYIDFNRIGNANGMVLQDSQSFDFPYISASFYHDDQSQWNPSVANYGPGGITGFTYSPYVIDVGFGRIPNAHQILISGSIPKTDVYRLRMTFRQVFGRVTFS